jgi:hypothetical protein
MNEAGECPRCKLAVQEGTTEGEGAAGSRDILDQMAELLRGLDSDGSHYDKG